MLNSTIPPLFGDALREPNTLATLAFALVHCPHPPQCVVSVEIASDEHTRRMTWCGACGAVSPDDSPDGPERYWQKPAIATLFTQEHFGELAELAEGLELAHRAIGEISSKASDVSTALAEIHEALAKLANITLVRDVARLDDMVRGMSHPSSPPESGPQATGR